MHLYGVAALSANAQDVAILRSVLVQPPRDGEPAGSCSGEAGTLTVQAATYAPNLPVVLIPSRLTAGHVIQADSDDDLSGEDGDGDERMHGAAGDDAIHMAVVNGYVAPASSFYAVETGVKHRYRETQPKNVMHVSPPMFYQHS